MTKKMQMLAHESENDRERERMYLQEEVVHWGPGCEAGYKAWSGLEWRESVCKALWELGSDPLVEGCVRFRLGG